MKRRIAAFKARALRPGAIGIAGVAIAAAAIVALLPAGDHPIPQPADAHHRTIPLPFPEGDAVVTPEAGAPELLRTPASDPSGVPTARRMFPQAWEDCRQGSADQAVTACKELLSSGIAKGGELAEIQVWNGRALHERHELDKALEALNASLATAPTLNAYSLRGTVHYDKGNWDQAIADYSAAIRLDAANGEAFNNRAWTYYRAGRSAKALSDANSAVRLLSKEAYVWDTRAHIHAALGNREAAIRDFRAALAIDPKYAASKAGLANLGVN